MPMRRQWKDLLASGQGNDAAEIISGRSALVPYPQKEMHRQRVDSIEVEKEWLESRRC
jgi:hypothetical protein